MDPVRNMLDGNLGCFGVDSARRKSSQRRSVMPAYITAHNLIPVINWLLFDYSTRNIAVD